MSYVLMLSINIHLVHTLYTADILVDKNENLSNLGKVYLPKTTSLICVILYTMYTGRFRQLSWDFSVQFLECPVRQILRS